MARRRRSRTGLALLLSLLFLVGAAAALDQGARVYAQRRAATVIGQRLGASEVTVKAHGWPFLAFLVTNTLPSVDVHTGPTTLHQGTASVPVNSMDVHLTNLRNPRNVASAVADQLTATATVPWSATQTLVGVPLTSAGNGRAKATSTVVYNGVSVPVSLTFTPGVTASGGIELKDPAAAVDGVPLPSGAALTQVVQKLTPRIKVPVPGHTTLTAVRATDAGIVTTITGTNINLDALG